MAAEKPKVVIVMPRYGDVSTGAARGMMLAGGESVQVEGFFEACVSATPRAFNICLIHALNLRDEGKATHMAMIHADIEPLRRDWLDVMYREMRIHSAALVSAIVPIKEPNTQRTSTAIGKIDNPWVLDRYVQPQHYGHMPETFGPDDVCHPDEELLVNTGLFLTDLRAPFWDSFEGFQFHNRIVRQDGRRVEQFRPEDWELSRHMRRCGAHYVATWAVPLVHHGHYGWSNR
jgi:hypothetical protein